MFLTLVITLIVIWLVLASQSVMKIKLVEGSIVKLHGKIPTPFKYDLSEIAQRSNLTGTIRVTRRCGQLKLHFSSSIPDNIQQRIRNVFQYNDISRSNVANKRKG
jgi:hypothetical protein